MISILYFCLTKKFFSGVDIEGNPIKIKYDRQFSTETTQKYSCSAIQWKSFVDTLKDIHDKILEINRK